MRTVQESLHLFCVVAFSLICLGFTACYADPTNSFPHLKYSSYPVLVVDDATGRPISRATVIPVCLGGTPYSTNIYHTNRKGITRVMSFERMLAVRVDKEGYKTNFWAFMASAPATNHVVNLKRLQK